MATKATKKSKPRYVRSEWIFDWKRPEATPVSTWLAVIIVGGVFALALVSLRVKLVEPVDWEAPQASVMHLNGEGWSRALVVEAKAKGPFPSRFEPDAWSGTQSMRTFMNQASQLQLKAHQPRLLPFPEPGVEPPRMARRGEPVLPYRAARVKGQHAVAGLRLVPILSAVDGIQPAELPKKLPAWDQPVTEVLGARPWKFLVELESSGRVRECVALAGGNELSPKELTAWLRGVAFPAKPGDQSRRWVAIAIEFHNRAATGESN